MTVPDVAAVSDVSPYYELPLTVPRDVPDAVPDVLPVVIPDAVPGVTNT